MDCATHLIQACVELGNWRFCQPRGASVLIKELAEASDDGRFTISSLRMAGGDPKNGYGFSAILLFQKV